MSVVFIVLISHLKKSEQNKLEKNTNFYKEVISNINFNSRQIELMCDELFNHKDKIGLTFRKMEFNKKSLHLSDNEMDSLFKNSFYRDSFLSCEFIKPY